MAHPKAKLQSTEVDRIVGLLTTWKGKLTWELVEDRVESLLGRRFTRQTLDGLTPVKIAFTQAKERVRRQKTQSTGGSDDDVLPEVALLLQKNEALTARIRVLSKERDELLGRFAIWLFNARSRGISEHDLAAPLPVVDREPSEKKKKERK